MTLRRQSMLLGTGAAVVLPFLDALVPVLGRAARATLRPRTRPGIGTSGDRLGQFYGGCDAVFHF